MVDRRDFVIGSLGALAASQLADAPAAEPGSGGASAGVLTSRAGPADKVPTLTARYAFSVSVFFKERIIIDSGKGRAYVPAIGGEIWGPRLTGKVVPYSGADFGTSGNLIAHYAFQAADGAMIYIVNYASILRLDQQGRVQPPRVAPPAPSRAAGELPAQAFTSGPTDPASQRFRTMPVFDAPDGPHAWMNRTVFVGHGVRQSDPDHSIFTYYELL